MDLGHAEDQFCFAVVVVARFPTPRPAVDAEAGAAVALLARCCRCGLKSVGSNRSPWAKTCLG